jgi:hypothetical protein
VVAQKRQLKLKATMIARLLEKEALLFPLSLEPVFRSDPWREKVVHWFFSVVSALARNVPAGVQHPFDRATVHVSTALLDNYLASLPQERSARYRANRVAYQVLATTCLLLGIRLVHSHQRVEAIKLQQQQQRDIKDEPSGEMRRTGKLRDLQQANAANEDDSLELPNIRSILRISAASKSITEATVLTMVREITSSRVFPRSHSVTALDFIEVFGARNSSNITSSSNGSLLHLEPSQQRNASLLADLALYCSRCKPSIAACAAITVVMMRSAPEDVTSTRQLVFQAVFGEHDVSAMQSVRDVEIRILEASTTLSRNGIMPRTLSSHVIPQEE